MKYEGLDAEQIGAVIDKYEAESTRFINVNRKELYKATSAVLRGLRVTSKQAEMIMKLDAFAHRFTELMVAANRHPELRARVLQLTMRNQAGHDFGKEVRRAIVASN